MLFWQGMNPEVEFLMLNDGKSEEETSHQAPEASITDQEMAEQWVTRLTTDKDVL